MINRQHSAEHCDAAADHKEAERIEMMSRVETSSVLILAIGDRRPDLDDDAWIAPGARVLGDVTMGAWSSLWYGAVLRADLAPICIGPSTNLQDNCVVHNDSEQSSAIGAGVSVGHSAVLHGATVEDGCLIGMSAVVMNRAVIGAGSLIAAGTVVAEGERIPPGSLVMGTPGKVKRALRDDESAAMARNSAIYVDLAGEHQMALASEVEEQR